MDICYLVSERSTCLRRKVGAVLVRDNQILTTGYNGAPKNHPHCDELGGCLRTRNNIPSGQRAELSYAVHAEQNCIAQAAYHGISTKDAIIYCTTFPCAICIKILINAGIKEVKYVEGYPDELSKQIIKRTNIKVTQI